MVTAPRYAPPDPGRASTLDDVSGLLRALKSWAGNPSYDAITTRVNRGRPEPEQVGKTTVVDCFRTGRRRFDHDLVAAVVGALHPDPTYVHQWRQALRVTSGLAEASGQVRVLDHLPPDPAVFIGRDDIVDRLRTTAGHGDGTVVISALEGMAGVGKTQLATRLGHLLLKDRAVDQAIFVNLRGFHPDRTQPPADPAAVLDGILRLLGLPGNRVPATLTERIARYRTQLAGRRVLLVLDNAADVEQVLPLLPQVPGCVTVLTSRRVLELPGAARAEIDVFTPTESQRYLTRIAGSIPVGDDPTAIARIAERCGHLPLALALVAGQMRAKPDWTLTDHADRLDERRATGRLDSGIDLALEVSYRALPDTARRLLRVLALHPGQAFDTHAAAALAGTDRQAAVDALTELTGHHLVQEAGSGRYALHDLVREFAAARAVDEVRRADRRTAVNRLLDYYLVASRDDMNRLDHSRVLELSTAVTSPVELPEPGAPGSWLDSEINNLAATTRIPTTDHDRPDYLFDLTAVLERYLAQRGLGQIALAVYGRALLAAEETEDVSRQARAVSRIAIVKVMQTRHLESLEYFDRAERLYTACGDEMMLAVTMLNRAGALTHIGRAPEARETLLHLLVIAPGLGDRLLFMVSLGNLALAELRMGRYEDSIGHHVEALTRREVADSRLQATMLGGLGEAALRMGRLDEAEQHLIESLQIIRGMANKSMEGVMLGHLGVVYLHRGRHQHAGDTLRQAISLSDESDNRVGWLNARNGLGELALAVGDLDEAVAEYSAAYASASAEDAGYAEQQARAQTGLGEARRRLGDLAGARRHFERARELWTGLNETEAARVETLLSP